VAEPGQTRKEQRVAAREERMQAEAARARQRRRLWQLGGALGLAAVVVVAVVLAFGGGDDGKKKLRSGETLAGQIEANARFDGIPQKGVALGDPDAPVTLVEFADLQCPFCMRYTIDVMPTLVAKYVKTGKVRMVFRDVAFLGTDSVRAQQMAAAAGLQNKLWEFIDIFYNNQGQENTSYVSDEFLMKIGNAVDGLDAEKAFDDRGIASIQRQLVEAQQEWQSYGLSGTPSFVMGRTGGDYEPVLEDNEGPTVELMSERIDAALKRAT
jgi:protein-disulfide isomerase